MAILKQVLFQLHWLLGITAGVILGLVGVTGAILSFEEDLVRVLSPGVVTVAPQPPLPVSELVDRIAAEAEGQALLSLTVFAVPGEAARARFAAPDGRRRGVQRYVDPSTGVLLGEPTGVAFMGLVR